jgi:exosortase
MVPLPGQLHNLISGPLQRIATAGAVFLLELFGSVVTRDGNVITLNGNTPLAVAEACSGLRMLTAFVVVGCVFAHGMKRTLPQKALIVFSAVPVAILCNLIRLVITAHLFCHVDSATAEKFFHDFAGWFMMPLAIGLLLIETWVFSHLFVTGRSDT